MLAVLEAFAVIAVIIAAGAVVGRTGVLGDNARMVLNRVAFHVGVPALLIITLSDSTPAQVFSLPLLVSAVAALVMFGASFTFAVVLRRRGRADATIGAWAASWVNSGNLGIPLSAYVLGSTTEVSVLLVFQTVVLVPLGVAIITSEAQGGSSVRSQVRSSSPTRSSSPAPSASDWRSRASPCPGRSTSHWICWPISRFPPCCWRSVWHW